MFGHKSKPKEQFSVKLGSSYHYDMQDWIYCTVTHKDTSKYFAMPVPDGSTKEDLFGFAVQRFLDALVTDRLVEESKARTIALAKLNGAEGYVAI